MLHICQFKAQEIRLLALIEPASFYTFVCPPPPPAVHPPSTLPGSRKVEHKVQNIAKKGTSLPKISQSLLCSFGETSTRSCPRQQKRSGVPADYLAGSRARRNFLVIRLQLESFLKTIRPYSPSTPFAPTHPSSSIIHHGQRNPCPRARAKAEIHMARSAAQLLAHRHDSLSRNHSRRIHLLHATQLRLPSRKPAMVRPSPSPPLLSNQTKNPARN